MLSRNYYGLGGSEGYSFRYPLDVQKRADQMRGQALAHGVRVIGQHVRTMFGSLRAALRRDAVYAELRSLDDHMLQDIGLTRGDIHGAVYANRLPANSNELPNSSQDVA